VGRSLKPRVNAVGPLKDVGAGHPDVGLFTEKQAEDQFPERGVIEVEGPGADLAAVVNSEQVRDKYLPAYRHVLVTNFWSFVLVNRGAGGQPLEVESFQLAEDEAAFWELAAQPRRLAQERGEQLVEYLKRVMLRPATVSRPRDVAWFLASYARDALARVNAAGEEALPGLAAIRQALEETLGVHFEGGEGDRFFRSTMIQTLFYGIFSAWVLWHNENPLREDRFDWRVSAYELHVPVIQVLFEQLSAPSKLRALNLVEVLDWVGEVLNRVDRGEFFGHFEEGQAVQYFYEPFLEAFSPELRKELGVWYTPREVVQYMVERVDTVLEEELGIADGMADENVYVLGPAAGTGAYLVEVLRKIAERERAGGSASLVAARVKAAARERVFGFELLPAPFVISHLQWRLLLRNLGVPLSGEQRAVVYLTNSLTGWDLDSEQPSKRALPFPELEKERDAARQVKQEKPVLVVIGNPPYNAYAGVSPEEEQGLVEPYKEGLIDQWKIKKFNLDDLYIRFFRLAEHRIAEVSGRGVVCYISNFSFLGEPSFVVMRQHLLSNFEKVWIDCLNGDSRETGKRTPSGKPDPSIFSTEYNPAGIRKGTAISLFVRDNEPVEETMVRFRNFWGVKKRQALLESLSKSKFAEEYNIADPTPANRFSLRPLNVNENYREWPTVVELSKSYPMNGPIERRGNSLIVFEDQREELIRNLKVYLDPEVSDKQVADIVPQFMKSSGEFEAEKTRQQLAGSAEFRPDRIQRYPYKPYDIRIAYLDNAIQPLFSRPSPDLLEIDSLPDNSYFITRVTADKRDEGVPFLHSSLICDYDCISGHARHFPFLLPVKQKSKDSNQLALFTEEKVGEVPIRANISSKAREYLLSTLSDELSPQSQSGYIWFHSLAIGYSVKYLDENADGIKTDWPRIPLPASSDRLEISADLGKRVSELLDTEQNIEGVTQGVIRSELSVIGSVTRVDDGALDPNKDFAVNASWGYLQRGHITMPGGGTYTERDYEKEELEAFAAGAEAMGLGLDQVLDLLGDTTYDVYLNEDAYWQNVPANVWDYTIGGYQVIKKWLSYREKRVLGRDLRLAEVQHVTDVARRLAAIVLLQPRLDANYQAVKGGVFGWG
jgi:hypothetical protein